MPKSCLQVFAGSFLWVTKVTRFLPMTLKPSRFGAFIKSGFSNDVYGMTTVSGKKVNGTRPRSIGYLRFCPTKSHLSVYLLPFKAIFYAYSCNRMFHRHNAYQSFSILVTSFRSTLKPAPQSAIILLWNHMLDRFKERSVFGWRKFHLTPVHWRSSCTKTN